MRILRFRLPEESGGVEVELKLSMEGDLLGLTNVSALRAYLEQNPDDFVTPAAPVSIPSTTQEERDNMKFFSASSPCWFEGCQELRDEYAQELKELEEKTGCKTGCNKGPLMKKFLQRVAEAQQK